MVAQKGDLQAIQALTVRGLVCSVLEGFAWVLLFPGESKYPNMIV